MNYGEIIQLGRHRLMCGDATKRDDVYKLVGDSRVDLVLTDPPYGIKIQKKEGNIGQTWREMHEHKILRKSSYIPPSKFYPLMIGDDDPQRLTAKNFYAIAKDFCKNFIIWGGQYFAHFLPPAGGWLVWDKKNGAVSFSDCELAYKNFGLKVKKYSQLWNGCCREGLHALNLKSRVHPSQKPVELHAHILEDFSQPDAVILDCFGGSGTTLIAAEITGRTCYMMEISPQYCDIIINRFNSLTKGDFFMGTSRRPKPADKKENNNNDGAE